MVKRSRVPLQGQRVASIIRFITLEPDVTSGVSIQVPTYLLKRVEALYGVASSDFVSVREQTHDSD